MALLNFSRIKQWLGLDNLTASDLNSEFNNVYTNVSAPNVSGASGYPATLTGMKAVSSPGGVGTEVLPVSISDEIKELRYQLNQIIGGAFWYSSIPASLTTLNSSVSSLNPSPANRIISGRVTTFNQPAYLVPAGSSNSVSLKATTTNLSTYIDGSPVSFLADLSLAGLTQAPASNNTALVNDSTLAAAQSTKTQGERASIIQIDTVGSNISGKSGQYLAFKKGTEVFIGQLFIDATTPSASFTNASPTVATVSGHGLNNGDQVTFAAGSLPTGVAGATLYFAQILDKDTFQISATFGGALINTTSTGSGNMTLLKNSCIKNCYRGWFFDSSDAAIARAALSDNDTITLLQASWLFLTNNANTPALDVTYNKPSVSVITPSSPAIGDFWLDLNVSQWKKYSGSSFVHTSAVFVGLCVQDSSNTIAARSADFSKSFSELNTFEVSRTDTATIKSTKLSDKISVYGTGQSYDYDQVSWNTATNLDTGVSLTASTFYYCYISDLGKPFLSDLAPSQRKFDLLGDYHPNKPWRCVGEFKTDGSSLVIASTVLFAAYHQSVLPDNFLPAVSIADRSIPAQKLENAPSFQSGLYLGGANYNGSAQGLVGIGGINSKTASIGGNYAVACSANPATNGLVVLRGYVDAASDGPGAGTSVGEGWTVTRPATGIYTVTFTNSFLDKPAIVCIAANGSHLVCHTTNEGVSSFQVVILTVGGSATNNDFSFVAVGQHG